MAFELPALPYAKNELVPHISEETLGSVDVLSKKLIYIFQLDNLKRDFFNRNSGKDYR